MPEQHALRLTDLSAAHPDALAAGMGPGVLEIKCPFNRGQPESASVPSLPPWYYMPQVRPYRKSGVITASASMVSSLQWPVILHEPCHHADTFTQQGKAEEFRAHCRQMSWSCRCRA